MVQASKSNKAHSILYAQDTSGEVTPAYINTNGNGLMIDIIDSSGNSIISGSNLKVDMDKLDTSGAVEVGGLIESLEGKDFANQATLSGLSGKFDTSGVIEVGELTENLSAKIDSIQTKIDLNIDSSGISQTEEYSRNKLIENTSVSWASGAASGTTNNIDIAIPDKFNSANLSVVLVKNLSTETELSVSIQNKWLDSSGASGYGELVKYSVITDENVSDTVEGMFIGESVRISLTNASALSSGHSFNAFVQVREA